LPAFGWSGQSIPANSSDMLNYKPHHRGLPPPYGRQAPQSGLFKSIANLSGAKAGTRRTAKGLKKGA